MATNDVMRPARIPLSLQSVFIASNRGEAVERPPPNAVANKLFPRAGSQSQYSILTAAKDTKAKHTRGTFTQVSPQRHLESILLSRGYSNTKWDALSTAYLCNPSELQKASYGSLVVGLIRGGDVDGIRSLLAAGISPNACNDYGESLLHLICRLGNHELLKIFLDYEATVQVADDYGRTPLHDACWAAEPSFEVIESLLSQDCGLLYLQDLRGSTPLDYVKKGAWTKFNEFLDKKKDVFWKPRMVGGETKDVVPELAQLEPNSRLVADPFFALTPELAASVSNGRITAFEAQFLHYRDDEEERESDSDDSDDDDDTDDDTVDHDCSDSYHDSFTEFDLEEMENILQSLSSVNRKPLAW